MHRAASTGQGRQSRNGVSPSGFIVHNSAGARVCGAELQPRPWPSSPVGSYWVLAGQAPARHALYPSGQRGLPDLQAALVATQLWHGASCPFVVLASTLTSGNGGGPADARACLRITFMEQKRRHEGSTRKTHRKFNFRGCTGPRY